MTWFDTFIELLLFAIVVRQGVTIDRLRAQVRRRRPSGSPLADPRHPSYPTDNLELPL